MCRAMNGFKTLTCRVRPFLVQALELALFPLKLLEMIRFEILDKNRPVLFKAGNDSAWTTPPSITW